MDKTLENSLLHMSSGIQNFNKKSSPAYPIFEGAIPNT